MPDTIPDDLDNGSAAQDIEDGGRSPANADNDKPKYAGKFKTPEEVAEAYEASERKMHEATEEAAKLREENERVRNDTLAKLADTLAKRDAPEGSTRADIERRKADLIKQMDDEGGSAIFETIRSSWTEHDAEIRDELKARDRKLQELEAKLAELSEVTAPEYQANREQVDRLMKEAGVSRQQAMKVVAMSPKRPVESSSAHTEHIVPGSMMTGRRPPSTASSSSVEAVVTEARQILPDMTAEEEKTLRARLQKARR